VSDTTVHKDLRGLDVDPCINCGRWSAAGIICCVPCCNGGQYPHQWLCEKYERERTRYPRELIDPRDICPKCDRELITDEVFFYDRHKWRCRDISGCGWSGDRPS
jgi:hypothetical protein